MLYGWSTSAFGRRAAWPGRVSARVRSLDWPGRRRPGWRHYWEARAGEPPGESRDDSGRVSEAQWAAIAGTEPSLVLVGPDSCERAKEWLGQALSHDLAAHVVDWGNGMAPAYLVGDVLLAPLQT